MKNTHDLTFLAPAKINLYLYVLYKRDDLYHEVSTMIVPITLFDTVSMTRLERGVVVECGGDFPVPGGEENIAYKAAELFFHEYGLSGGVKVTIKKRIPSGAGLGGGSSDGAAVMKGLDVLYRGRINEEELISLAAGVGADVPFFICPRPSRASGKGELLTPVTFDETLHILLVKPERSIDTHAAYGMLERESGPGNMGKGDWEELEKADPGGPLLHNDFEKVLFGLYPDLGELKERLMSVGAYGASVTGSGSCVFGLFDTREKAEKAKSAFQDSEYPFAKVVENF